MTPEAKKLKRLYRFQLLQQMQKDCSHEFKKVLADSGMYFISWCHKCHKELSYIHE